MQVRPVLAIVVATVFLSLPARSSRGERDPKVDQVATASPVRRAITLTQAYVCQIRGQRHLQVRSLERGTLDAIAVKEGQAVKKGDRLFDLGPAANARRRKDAETEAESLTIKAPFDGIVGPLRAKEGSLIEEGELLTTLSDSSVMWVYFYVPEDRYRESMASPKQIEKLRFELVLADGSMLNGKLGATEPDFSETGAIPCRANFPNPGRLLHHGQTGLMLVHRVVENSIVIPAQATFEADGKQCVYVIDKDRVAHRREIAIQNIAGDLLVVGKGLDAHDTIVVGGIEQIHDGDRVPVGETAQEADRQPG